MKIKRVLKLLKGKCPKCEEGNIFDQKGNVLLLRPPKMLGQFPRCSHVFELEPGYFFGAMYVSYALSVAELEIAYIILQFFVTDINIIFISMVSIIGLMSFLNFRYSRIIWMYLFTQKNLN